MVAIGCAYALSAAFRLITHLHLANSEHCTFQVVHYGPGSFGRSVTLLRLVLMRVS